MQLTDLEIVLALMTLLIGGSVLVLNILRAIKLWRDMNKPDDEQ